MTAERAIFWKFDPVLGWRHIPSTRAPFVNRDFQVTVSINSQGMRGAEQPVERTSKQRMLVLGDSFGWGFGVNDEEVFSSLLQQQHPDWEILNASVSGYGTVQQFLYLEELYPKLKPDVVLVMFYDNDFQDNVGKTEYWYRRPVVSSTENGYAITGTPVSPPTFRERLDVYILGNFYLGRILYEWIHAPWQLAESGLHSGTMAVPEDDLAATGYVLDQMMQWAKVTRVRLVVVASPLSDRKWQVLDSHCSDYQLHCFHLRDTFNAHRKEPWHFEHDRHWNALGHRIVAGAVDDFLVNAGVWQPPAPVEFHKGLPGP